MSRQLVRVRGVFISLEIQQYSKRLSVDFITTIETIILVELVVYIEIYLSNLSEQ